MSLNSGFEEKRVLKPPIGKERRSYPRAYLDLPVEFKVMGFPFPHGGIAINGSEVGLLLHALREMPLGTRLDITIIFANGFELGSFDLFGEIVRRNVRREGQIGQHYGLRMIRISEENRLKFRYVLSGLHELLDRGTMIY